MKQSKINDFFSAIVNRHQELSRYAIIAAAVVLISAFFPKSGYFKYDYELGKPWKYENLIAPFNFGIQKNEEELKAEKELFLKDQAPYYRFDGDVSERRKEIFTELYKKSNTGFGQISDSVFHQRNDTAVNYFGALRLLNDIFSKGIIQLASEHREYSKDKNINLLLDDNRAERKKLSDFYTVQEAYEKLNKSIKQNNSLNQDFLMPILKNVISHNVFYDAELTKRFQQEALDEISLTRGMIQEGEMIISKGAIVTPAKIQVLNSFKNEYEKRVIGLKKSQVVFFGNILLVAIILIVFTFFLRIFSNDVFESVRKLLFIISLIVLMTLVLSKVVETDLPIIYAIPFCIIAIVLRTFFGARVAFHAHITLVLLSSFVVPQGVEFLFLQTIAGMVAIYTSIKAHYWSQFFLSNGFILLAYFSAYFAITIVQEGSFDNFNYANFGWLALNVLLTLLAYPLIPVFEKLFGFVSEITLLEYSDINKPLLKELSLKAPGSFNHSLQVANLAEAAASEVGANSMLVKIGALYHDIGKMYQPLYFIENQQGGINPHDDLEFDESATIIINHVKKGIERAKKEKLPDMLIDFIRTHHGTTRVEYFYRSFIKRFPDKEVAEGEFTYPGPLPYSKETAILMMADTVEAASRSLKNPSSEDIENLVDKLIQSKMDQDQFINSDITFKDITRIKKVLKKMLNSIYHVRIAYPE
ncbi:MAG: HDIG domain-containing metalloprotein [Chitinophagales bacterium]